MAVFFFLSVSGITVYHTTNTVLRLKKYGSCHMNVYLQKKSSIIHLFLPEYRNSTPYEWLGSQRLFVSSRANQPTAVCSTGSRAESAQCHLASPLMSCMLDVHWERSIVSETARANSCPLLWCLLMQLLSTQLRIPTAAVSISPAKADVVSAAHAQISCPHRCPPTPKSSFSLLAEQNSLLVLTRHLPCHTFRTLCWEPS